MTRKVILQDTRRKMLAVSNDTIVSTHDDLRDAYSTNEVLGPRRGEVCVLSEMIMSLH